MSNITVQQIKDLTIAFKDNTGNATDDDFILWANFLNQFVYNKIANVNPDDFLLLRTVKTISDVSQYTTPTDFKNFQFGGFLETDSGTEFSAINYDAETVAFTTIGQTITGGTSGATGVLVEAVDFGTTGTLRMSSVSGTFQDNETLTGSTEGSATSNGTAIGFTFSNRKQPITGFGSQAEGVWVDSNFNKTPLPKSSQVFIARYFPLLTKLTTLTGTTGTTIIPTPDYDEFVRNSVDVYWTQWRANTGDEIAAQQRSTAALVDLLKTIKKTPAVMKLIRRSGSLSGERLPPFSVSERR